MPIGLYRAYNVALGQECARIDAGNPLIEAFLSREAYTAKGCQPAFDDLPTKEDYTPPAKEG